MNTIYKSILLTICFLTLNLLSASIPQPVVEYSLGQLTPTGGRNKEQYSNLIVDYQKPALTNDHRGIVNRAYDIQNSEQYLRLQSFQVSSQEFSLTLWIKFSSNNSNGEIYNLVLDNNGKKTIIYLDKDEIEGDVDEWILVGSSIKDQSKKAYFYNGDRMDRQIVSQKINLSESTKLSLYIGNDDVQTFPFIGQISDLHIYDVALGIDEFRLLKDLKYQLFKPEWQTVFLLENNLIDMRKQIQLSFEEDYTQKQSKGYKSLNRFGNENSAIKLVSNEDTLYLPKSLIINESNQTSISIVFKTNHADHLTFLKIVDENNNIIFQIKDKTIKINNVVSTLPKPLYSNLSKNQFHLMNVIFDLNSDQVILYVSGEKLGVYPITNNQNKQFMKEISYTQIVEISAAQENQSIIIDDVYVYDKVLDPQHVEDIKDWKIGRVKPKMYTQQFFRLNEDLQSEIDLNKKFSYPKNYVKQYNEFENVYGFNNFNDFSVKNFFGNNPLKTNINLFDFNKITLWVRFDNNYDTANSVVAKITNDELGKPYDFEVTIKRDSMHFSDQYKYINQTIPFTQSLNKEKGNFNLITLQYVKYRMFQVKTGNTIVGTYSGKLSFFQYSNNFQIGLILGQYFYGQMFNIRIINPINAQNSYIDELQQLGNKQNDNFLQEALDEPTNGEKLEEASNHGNNDNIRKDEKDKNNENSINNGQFVGVQNQNPSKCEEQLKDLTSRNINIDFLMIENNSIMEHFYTIHFGGFTQLNSCFSITAQLANNPIAYSLSPDKKQMFIKFNNDKAVSKGCVQVTPQELECKFELQLSYKNVLQIKKSFTSIVQANDLNNIQNGLQLQIIGDQSNSIRNVCSAVNTEVHLCIDVNCSEYKDELVLNRNEIAYVEMKVTTPQYQDLYPVHKSLKLGGKEIQHENLPETQNWDQQGRIIYQIKPDIANDNQLLQIQIALVDNINRNRILISERQQNHNIDDMIGKQIFINIKEYDSKQKQNEQSKTSLIFGISLGSIGIVSLTVSVVILVFLKKKLGKVLQTNSQSKTQSLVKTLVEIKSKQGGSIDPKFISDIVIAQ